MVPLSQTSIYLWYVAMLVTNSYQSRSKLLLCFLSHRCSAHLMSSVLTSWSSDRAESCVTTRLGDASSPGDAGCFELNQKLCSSSVQLHILHVFKRIWALASNDICRKLSILYSMSVGYVLLQHKWQTVETSCWDNCVIPMYQTLLWLIPPPPPSPAVML